MGFIRNLPKELLEAFRATLEELGSADTLVHVADASHPELKAQIEAVESILEDLHLLELPRILVLNKWDLLPSAEQECLLAAYPQALPASARTGAGLGALLARLEQELFLAKPLAG